MRRLDRALLIALPFGVAAGCTTFGKSAEKPNAPATAFHAGKSLSSTDSGSSETRPPTAEELLDSQVKLAGYHCARRELPQAKAYLDKALTAAPKHVPALIQLSKYYLAAGDEAKARAVLQQALALDPGSSLAWNEVGTLRSGAGDYGGAIEALTKALERSPNQSLYLENLGSVYTLAGNYESAYQAYVRALGPAEARYRLAGALYARGDLGGARRQLAAGAAESPNHAPTLRMLAALDSAEATQAPDARQADGGGATQAGYTSPAR